jgi:hypothetical protein
VRARFFGKDGALLPSAAQKLATDIAPLLVPSKERALALDRAYLALVRAQSFTRGRDVVVGAAPQVLDSVVQDDATGIEDPIKPGWAQARLAARK